MSLNKYLKSKEKYFNIKRLSISKYPNKNQNKFSLKRVTGNVR